MSSCRPVVKFFEGAARKGCCREQSVNASAGDHFSPRAFIAFSSTPGSSPLVKPTPAASRARRIEASWASVGAILALLRSALSIVCELTPKAPYCELGTRPSEQLPRRPDLSAGDHR